MGFSIDLVEQAIVPALNKKLNKQIKVEKKESAPQTRIPLLTSNAVDLIAETMTDTQARRDNVDFSLTFFVTGAQFLVRKGSPIKGIQTSPANASRRSKARPTPKSFASACPPPSWSNSPISPRPFKRSLRSKCEAYTNDGIQLAGLRAKAPKPDDWAVVGEFFSYEPYGMAMRKNDSDFRQVGQRRPDGRDCIRPLF